MSEQNDPITKNPKDAVQDFLHSSAKPEDSEDGDEVVTQFNPETGEEETVTTREVSKTAQKVVKKVVAKQVCQTTVKKEMREIEEVEEVHTIKKKLFQDGKEIDCQETSNTTKTTGEKVIQGPEEVTKEETVVMITEETNPEGSTDKTITKTINKEHTIKDDNTIINIADDGSYTIIGDVGDKATITAYLKGNPNVNAQCVVEVVETLADVWSIDTEPEISIIKQYESIDVAYTLYRNNVKQDNVTVGINVNSDNISIISMGVNTYKFTGVKISPEPVEYSIEAKDVNGDIVYTETKSITVTSMLGG